MRSASADPSNLGELVGSLGISSLLIDEYSLRRCGIDALDYGQREKLINPRAAIRISLDRMLIGIPLTEDETRIALALSDEEPMVFDELDDWELTPDSLGEAERLWQYCTFSALLRGWQQREFPEADFWDLIDGWDYPIAWVPPWRKRPGQGSRRRIHAWLQQVVGSERRALCET